MPTITYTAKSQIAAGHTIDTLYSIEVGLRQYRPSLKVKDKRHESLSGEVETWVANKIQRFNCETVPILQSDLLHSYMWEFLSSCIGGETFIFDRFGTIATPNSPVNCILESKSIDPIPHPTLTLSESFPFEIRQLV